MLHPTIKELTKDEFNRYELALATAKCARILTDEYVKQREESERAMIAVKEGDRATAPKVDDDLKDEKAIKNAITRFWDGRYEIYRGEDAEGEDTAETAEIETEAEAETEVVEEVEAEAEAETEVESEASDEGQAE